MKDRSKFKFEIVESVLMVDWDPIGVFGIPEAIGEYDSYAWQVLGIAERGGTPLEIATFLREIEVERMELVRNGTTDDLRIGVANRVIIALARFEE